MLTRIEIDGFKSFRNFELKLRPFTVILGPNASGKSNLFDAIQLLSRLASESSVGSAFDSIKERGIPGELFSQNADGSIAKKMTFGIEVLLDSQHVDVYGSVINLEQTRVRYDLTIEKRDSGSEPGRLFVTQERVTAISAANQDNFWLDLKGRSSLFNRTFIKRQQKKKPYLETVEEEGQPRFHIHQEGNAGRSRTIPAANAEATVLSSCQNSKETPTLYALREEMASWRFLQLDPDALRKPSPEYLLNKELNSHGSNLPAVLARIRSETRGEDLEGALADISADMARLIPGVKRICVEVDKKAGEYSLKIVMTNGQEFSSRVVSDGTLRVLALLTMLHDPRHHGLILFEEPENGVHPLRLKETIRVIRRLLTTEDQESYDPDQRLCQMLINSHSPVVLSCCLDETDLVYLDTVTRIDPLRRTKESTTRVRRIHLQGDLIGDGQTDFVSAFEVQSLLESWRDRSEI